MVLAARRPCGRACFRVSSGGVAYWVQAETWSRAGVLVRRAMRAEGMGEDEISEFFRSVTITRQSWQQLLDSQIRDDGVLRPMLSAFVGGRDEVLACTEWDG